MSFKDFFKPKYKHSDWKVREKAVKEITDEKKLIEIAKNDNSFTVIKTAVNKISDEEVLKDLAKKGNKSILRETAIEKISDEEFLNMIAEDENENTSLRYEAAKKNR